MRLKKDLCEVTMDEDKKLMEIYWAGWNDSGNNNPRFREFSGIEHTAYQLGWCDYIIGDDCRSVDYQTEEQILNQIKNYGI